MGRRETEMEQLAAVLRASSSSSRGLTILMTGASRYVFVKLVKYIYIYISMI